MTRKIFTVALLVAALIGTALAARAPQVRVIQLLPSSTPEDSTIVIKGSSLFTSKRGAMFWSLAAAADTVRFRLQGGAFGTSGQTIVAAPGTVHSSMIEGSELDTLKVDRRSTSAYVSIILWGR